MKKWNQIEVEKRIFKIRRGNYSPLIFLLSENSRLFEGQINFEVFTAVRHFRDTLSYPRISCNKLGLFSSLAQGLLT